MTKNDVIIVIIGLFSIFALHTLFTSCTLSCSNYNVIKQIIKSYNNIETLLINEIITWNYLKLHTSKCGNLEVKDWEKNLSLQCCNKIVLATNQLDTEDRISAQDLETIRNSLSYSQLVVDLWRRLYSSGVKMT